MLGIASYPLTRYLWDRSRQKERLNQMMFYQGEVNFTTGTEQVTVINIDGDTTFLWLGLRSACFLPALNLPTSPADAGVMVRYGGPGGRGFSQSPIDIRNCAPSRPVPFMLPCPRPMAAGSTLHVTVTLRTGGAANTSIAFQFFGFKAFNWRGDIKA